MVSLNKNFKIAFLSLFLSIAGICALKFINSFFSAGGINLNDNSIMTTILSEGIILIIPYLIIKKHNEGKFNLDLIDMKFTKINIKHIINGLGMGLLMFGAYKFILYLMKIEKYKGIGFQYYSASVVLVSVAIAFALSIFTAICEEVFFRGVLFNYLNKDNNEKFGLIVSSIVFTLFHLNTNQNFIEIAEVVILGIALGYCYILTKSLYLSIALHFAWNFYNALTAVGGIGLFIFNLNKNFGLDYCNHIIMVAESIIEITVAIILIIIDIKSSERKIPEQFN